MDVWDEFERTEEADLLHLALTAPEVLHLAGCLGEGDVDQEIAAKLRFEIDRQKLTQLA